MKRALCFAVLLFSFCLLFSLSVFAGDTLDFTAATGDLSGSGWAWNQTTRTFTVSGVELTAESGPVLRLPPNSRLLFSGDAKLTSENASAVEAQGFLTVGGSGTLQVLGADYGIDCADVVLMANGITITGEKAAGSGVVDTDGGFEMKVSQNRQDYFAEVYAGHRSVKTDTLYPVYVTVGRGGGASFYTGMFAPGDTVVLSARPRYGYGLKTWNAPAAEIPETEEKVLTFTMPARPVRVFGTFERVYHVSVPEELEGGRVEFITTGPYTPGQQVILYAVPDTGYYFSHWTSNYGRFRDPLQSYAALTMPSINSVCTPVFVKGEAYRLSVEIVGGGKTNIDFGNFPQNKSVLLRATPDEGYVFSGWMSQSGHFVSSTAMQTYFTMPGENTVVKAVFSLKEEFKKNLTVSPLVGGTVNVTGGAFVPGMPITLLATPKTGYRFVGWSIEPESYKNAFLSANQPETDLLMPPEDVTISARFELLDPDAVTFYLSVGTPTGGTFVCEGAGNYLAGYELDLSATPDEGYYFAGWKSAVGGKFENAVDPNTIFYMPANDTQITAVFSPILSVGDEEIKPSAPPPTDGADLEPPVEQNYLSFGLSLFFCASLTAGGTWYAGVSRREAGIAPLRRRKKRRRLIREMRPRRTL